MQSFMDHSLHYMNKVHIGQRINYLILQRIAIDLFAYEINKLLDREKLIIVYGLDWWAILHFCFCFYAIVRFLKDS